MNDIEQFVNKFGLTPFWSVVIICLLFAYGNMIKLELL